VIIGFPAHGTNKKKCESVIEEYNNKEDLKRS